MELDVRFKKDRLFKYVEARENEIAGGGKNAAKTALDDLDIHESDIAEFILELYDQNRAEYDRVIHSLPPDLLGLVALEMPETIQEELAEKLGVQEWADVVNELETDDATDIVQKIEEIDEEKAYEIMLQVDSEHKEDIERLKRFDDDSAGAIMQTELFSAKLGEKISDSIKRLKTLVAAEEISNIHFVFVIDDHNKLKAMLSLEALIMLDLDKTYAESIDDLDEPVFVYANDTIETVTQTVERYDLAAIAVVDNFGHLLGRITSDDIYDLIEDQATEQIYALAQVGEDLEHKDGVSKNAFARARWLLLNLFSSTFGGWVVSHFTDAIEQVVALAVFMPVVASMGGVAGTQTLTVIVRKLALGQVKLNDTISVMAREIATGLLNGGLFASAAGVLAWLWFGMPLLGVTVGLALLCNFFYAGFFGSMIPLTLKRFNIDPAVASSTLLTTVTDVAGFFTFLTLATMILLK
ncbi:MAG: magnesium transporter [Helicobacteraceae bacterium]|jgi:magnesium transporter|nr:magnesium transporter [Helicobacteraceae bacterium]